MSGCVFLGLGSVYISVLHILQIDDSCVAFLFGLLESILEINISRLLR